MKRISKRIQWTAVVMLMVMGIPVMLYAATSVIEELNVFSPNTVISSTKVNENFVMLDERIATYEDAITVDGNGNVGVGTTEPSAKLQVSGGNVRLDADRGIKIGSNEGGFGYASNVPGMRLSGYSGVDFFSAVSTADFTFTNNEYGGGKTVTIKGTGNVGIGTTSPSNKLEIVGNGTSPATSGITQNGALRLGYVGGQGVLDMGMIGSGIGGWLQAGNNTNLSLSYPLLLNPNGGNVGIGTTAPATKLDLLSAETTPTNLVVAQFMKVSTSPANSGSAIVRIGNNNNRTARSLELEYNDGNAGPFRYGSYGDANIISTTDVSNGAFGNIHLVTGNSISRSIAMTVGGGTQKGNVGIGTTTPTQKLHVVGKVTADDYLSNSDSRLKRDITPLENAVDGIACLQGVTYRWEDAASSQDLQLGLIAQDVERCYPEVVSTDSKGFKSVSYARLVAPLIEAVKEQQRVNITQQQELAAMKARLARIELLLKVPQ